MKVDLSIYEKPNKPFTKEFARTVAMSLAGTMQTMGLSKVGVAISNGAISKKVVLGEFSSMPFAPKSLQDRARLFASAIAESMAAAGIVSISIDTSSPSDRSSLESFWNSSLHQSDAPRLIPPPGAVEDLEPIHVSF